MSRLLNLLLGLTVLLGSAVAHAGTVTYVYTDPQGTPLAEANASGMITATFDYKPYGSQVLGSPKAGPGYTGHVNDPDTGFVYMQARYYDPLLGRFLSLDPVDPKPADVYSFNRYDYANNNPVINIDTDGRETGVAFKAINEWTTQPYTVGSAGDDLSDIADALDSVDRALAPLGPDGGAEFHLAAAPLVTMLREASIVTKAERLAVNVKNGAAVEEAVGAKLGSQVAGRRITLQASTGERSVADFVTKDSKVIEAKAGDSALSRAQKAVRADIKAGRPVTPRGQNAARAGLTPGQPLKMKDYEVDRTK